MTGLIRQDGINKAFILTMLFLKCISDVWQDYHDSYKKKYGNAPKLIEVMMQQHLTGKNRIVFKEEAGV